MDNRNQEVHRYLHQVSSKRRRAFLSFVIFLIGVGIGIFAIALNKISPHQFLGVELVVAAISLILYYSSKYEKLVLNEGEYIGIRVNPIHLHFNLHYIKYLVLSLVFFAVVVWKNSFLRSLFPSPYGVVIFTFLGVLPGLIFFGRMISDILGLAFLYDICFLSVSSKEIISLKSPTGAIGRGLIFRQKSRIRLFYGIGQLEKWKFRNNVGILKFRNYVGIVRLLSGRSLVSYGMTCEVQDSNLKRHILIFPDQLNLNSP